MPYSLSHVVSRPANCPQLVDICTSRNFKITQILFPLKPWQPRTFTASRSFEVPSKHIYSSTLYIIQQLLSPCPSWLLQCRIWLVALALPSFTFFNPTIIHHHPFRNIVVAARVNVEQEKLRPPSSSDAIFTRKSCDLVPVRINLLPELFARPCHRCK